MSSLARASAIAAICLFPGGVATAQAPAGAIQDSSAGADEPAEGEIIVTARKRNESLLDIPVSVTALGQAQLERYATSDLQAVSTQVPGLFVSNASSSGTLALRGIASSPGNPAADQGVSVNVDGLQVGSPLIMRLAQVDLAQIEVLKGPQALFFGKNSPGGIISLRTADPGSSFEGRAIVSHEFEADETTGQLVLSGPLTDTLGARVVLFGNRILGDVRNPVPVIPGISYGPTWRRTANYKQFYGRATLLFKPSDSFTLRAKYSHSDLRGSNPFGMSERSYCPNGTAQLLGLPVTDDCTVNGVSYNTTELSPAMYAASAATGLPLDREQTTKQDLGSLEANLTIAPDITLTSLTGYYKLSESRSGNVAFQSAPLFATQSSYTRREISQEIRLTTAKADWPVNFMVGAFYQDLDLPNDNIRYTDRYTSTRTLPLGTITTSATFYDTSGKTYSLFGQAIWNITPEIELAGGARVSKETKRMSMRSGTTASNLVPVTLPVSKRTFNDVSPEVTLTYKPMRGLSMFAAFRNGFKSGGFNAAGAGGDLSYKPEDIKGFEAGIKGDLGDFRFGATAYTYKYTNAQVYTFNPTLNVQTVLNAASARIRGIEADVTWRPSAVDGLEFHANANYNRARYLQFLVGCFVGQTVAEGCDVGAQTGGVYRQQDLSGRQLMLAPDWTGNVGFVFERPLGMGDLRFGATGDLSFSSSYVTILEDAPGATQSSYQRLNASLRLSDPGAGWELALIGDNLNDKRVMTYTGAVPFTGISTRTGSTLGGGQADLYSFITRGRQVRLQASFKF